MAAERRISQYNSPIDPIESTTASQATDSTNSLVQCTTRLSNIPAPAVKKISTAMYWTRLPARQSILPQ